MQRHIPAVVLLVAVCGMVPVFAHEALRGGASGEGVGTSATVRVGIPTDVLLNLDLYTYGLGVDGGLGFQVTPRLIAGGIVGFGSLSAFSGSLVLGAVYIPRGDQPVIPNLGISLDYRCISIGLTTAAVSAGVNLSM